MSSTETTQPVVRLKGFKDLTNTTTTPLVAGATFTPSSWIYLADQSQVTVTVKSDQVGTLIIEKSSTGVTVGETDSYPYIRVGEGMKKGLGAGGIYYRIKYTNGAVNQTTFSLHTYINTVPTGFSFQQINDPQLDSAYALNTLANISGTKPDGTHAVVPLMTDNTLSVTSTPYLYAIAEGDVPGHTILTKLGYTLASTAAQTTLWNPGTEYVFPAGAISVEAISTSANDTLLGSGAKTVHLSYLDTTYAAKTFTFDMNGATAVAGPTDFFRVNSFHVETGTGAAGVITLRLVGGAATIYSQMPVGATRARNSVYTVPLGKTLYVESMFFSASYKTSGKTVRLTLHASRSPEGVSSTTGLLFYPYYETLLMDSAAYDPSDAPEIFPEKTDIKVSVIGETLAQCTSKMSGWLE